MAQYIDKSAVVAEIEECYNECLERAKIIDSEYWNGKADAYRNILVILDDSLEVREVKEPTASDRGMAEEIIINLKRVEQDYHIDLTREMEWIRNKAQKGEVEL